MSLINDIDYKIKKKILMLLEIYYSEVNNNKLLPINIDVY